MAAPDNQSMIAGLFTTPQEYQQQQQAQNLALGAQMAQLSPSQQGIANIYAGGRGLGQAVGGALGAPDEQLQMITQQQQLLKGLDLNDPQSLVNGARQATQMGNINLANSLLQRADQAQQRLVTQQSALRQQQARELTGKALQYQPATINGVSAETVPQVDENNQPLREALPGYQPAKATFNYEQYKPFYMSTPEGRTEYGALVAQDEAKAKLDEATAKAIKTQQEAKFAPLAQEAETRKKIADASKAVTEAEFAPSIAKIGLDKSNWDIKNLQSQIGERGAKLGLDTQLTQARVMEIMSTIQKNINDIPAETRKEINTSAVTAATAKQTADQFNALANRIESSGMGYGAFADLSEFLKKGAGIQGGVTELRTEYVRLRNQSVIKSLPPGAASDKDIQIALSGFPPDSADAAYISKFLRGFAKLQDIESAVAGAKTDWLAQNNGVLTRAKRGFIAGDFTSKPGESFNDLASRIAQEVSSRYTNKPSSAADLIPTPMNPNPQATSGMDIRAQADAILSGRR